MPAAKDEASSPDKTSKTEDGDKADEEECKAEFAPVVQLKETKVQSGEEEETEFYREYCMLYRFDPDEKAWKTRGKGYVKLMQHNETKKVRVILREDKTLKLRMNHIVNPAVELKPNAGSEKSWTWASTDYASYEALEETFAIKFRTEALASDFKKKHDEARKLNGSSEAGEASEATTKEAKSAPSTQEATPAKAKEEKSSSLGSFSFSSPPTSTTLGSPGEFKFGDAAPAAPTTEFSFGGATSTSGFSFSSPS